MEENESPKVASIRNEWDWVKPGIEEILNESPQFAYRPEDVYADCINGKAQLWVTEEGFVVTTAEYDSTREETYCFVWLAWAKVKGNNVALKHEQFFIDQAMNAGYDGIKFTTTSTVIADYAVQKAGWCMNKIELMRKF